MTKFISTNDYMTSQLRVSDRPRYLGARGDTVATLTSANVDRRELLGYLETVTTTTSYRLQIAEVVTSFLQTLIN